MMAFGGFFKNKKSKSPLPSQPASPGEPMVEIGTLLVPSTILFAQSGGKKSVVIKSLVRALSLTYPDIPEKTAFQAVMEREKVTTTFMESGIAVPHARLPSIPSIRAALAVLAPSAGSSSSVGESDPTLTTGTNFVFLFLSPQNNFTTHLQTLSRASWLFQNSELKNQLMATTNPEEALKMIRQVEQQTTHGPTA